MHVFTGCFLRPEIKGFCLIFTKSPDRIWFCLILVSDFFSTIIPRIWSMILFDLIYEIMTSLKEFQVIKLGFV